jgi:TIR domain
MSGRLPRWDAFISYSSADAAAARRVQRVLERYRLPDKRRLRVYRDETDIAGGELPAQLRQALGQSACLVVCCSRAAARSHWVRLEIDAFLQLAPGRPILPVLIADEPSENLPPPLEQNPLRWADLRSGWRLGLPKARTRIELVRVIAAVAGLEFRTLLPLDRRRRRLMMLRAASALVAALFAMAWIPVRHWTDVTPEGPRVFQCDTLDDGIAYFLMNPPQATKNIVSVKRNVFGSTAGEESRDDDVIPRGRLLPVGTARAVQRRCPSAEDAWIGEPEAGTCVALRASDVSESFDDPMGGFEAQLTDAIVGEGPPFALGMMWTPPDRRLWDEYGRTVTPSAGLPIAAAGPEIWVGFPDNEFVRGSLWRTLDGGQKWEMMPGITNVRSVRRVGLGVLVAARREGEFGFWRFADDGWVALDVPGKGDDLEICGEADGQPVIRADRRAFRRAHVPWWRTQFE